MDTSISYSASVFILRKEIKNQVDLYVILVEISLAKLYFRFRSYNYVSTKQY